MQENEVERKRNTNSKGSSFTSIAWVLELIDRTLVYGVFLLQVQNEDRIQLSRKEKLNNTEQKNKNGSIKTEKYECIHRKRKQDNVRNRR